MANPEWDNYRLATRNSDVLADFTKFCEDHPDQRFWQALRNWADVNFIFFSNRHWTDTDSPAVMEDTFYRDGK